MRIGALARETGLNARTIRYYESVGVLPTPERKSNGYRDYDQGAVERLGFVKDSQAAGLSLAEIQWILELRDSGESTCGHPIGLLESHLADIDRQMVELGRTRSQLQRVILQARAMDPAECTNPNRCQPIKES